MEKITYKQGMSSKEFTGYFWAIGFPAHHSGAGHDHRDAVRQVWSEPGCADGGCYVDGWARYAALSCRLIVRAF